MIFTYNIGFRSSKMANMAIFISINGLNGNLNIEISYRYRDKNGHIGHLRGSKTNIVGKYHQKEETYLSGRSSSPSVFNTFHSNVRGSH